MSDAVLIAVTGVAIATINMVGTVLLLLIRARYKWRNGTEGPPQPPP